MTVIFVMFSHTYVYLYCEGGFETPTKSIHPLTQKSWFISDTQLKVVHQFLMKAVSTKVNKVNLARYMNVSVQLIENLHRHIRGRYAWSASKTSEDFLL